jgi:endonuclease/exonuclease/phosphatase family metal-dependent hydrolase
MRVMSYNVHGLRDDRSALAEVVREVAPDVLVVQEAPRRLRWRTRNAQLAHALDLVYVTGGAPSLGNVIMTNLAVRPYGAWELRYPLTPGRHMRGAAFARCTADGVSFVVAGSHLATDPAERPGQARLLKKALTDHGRHSASAPQGGATDRITTDAPVILTVDLNDEPGGVAWQTLAEGLVDAAGEDASATFPATGQRLDAIMVDPRIAVSSYRVVDSPAARRASDHLPVVADLTLPG